MQKIISNRIKCKKCGDIIESTYAHDFKLCSCGAVGVDGGKDYLRRQGNPDNWEELSEVRQYRSLEELVQEKYNMSVEEYVAKYGKLIGEEIDWGLPKGEEM